MHEGLLASVWARTKDNIVTRDNFEEQHAQVILSFDQNHASIDLEATILPPKPVDGPEESIVINEDDDNLRKKLDTYTTTLSPTFQTSEPTPRLRSTLALASSLAPEDPLLANVLHLWTLSQLLLPTAPPWIISIIDPLHSSPTSSTPHANPPRPRTHALLTLHVRATLESLAAPLARTLLLALERRLERRIQCQNVSTLLVGVLLLHCVEGMSSLFTSFFSNNDEQEWPLDKPGEYYAAQAARFAEFVVKLFRMRGVGMGVGMVVEEETGRVVVKGGEGDEVFRDWVEGLGLREGEMGEKEGMVWGGLLLPER